MGDDGGHHGFDKHAVAHGAVEVALALNAAIVLPALLLEFDAHPLADLKVRLSSEADGAFAPIGQLDRLASLEVGHYRDSVGGEKRIVSVRSLGVSLFVGTLLS